MVWLSTCQRTKMIAAKTQKIRRKWQVFPGRTRFYCNGRFMLSPQTGVFFVSFGLILVTNVLYFVFDCPYLAAELSLAFPIVGAALCAIVMSNLFRTAFMDPGILPRAQRYEAAYYEAEASLAEQSSQNANIPGGYRSTRTKELSVGGQQLKLKWCLTCKMFRPPRVSHCGVCDNCVERFDHHCPWVGNCIGARNYRYFYYFILTLTVDAVYILACNVVHIVTLAHEFSFLEALRLTPATIIEAFICFLSLWSLVGLLGYHSYLLMRNLTTNEDIKGSFSKRRGRDVFNPFARRTWLHNCCFVLCASTPSSFVDSRALYIPDAEIKSYYNSASGVRPAVAPAISRDLAAFPESNNGSTLGPSAAFTPAATFQRGSSFYGNSRRPGGVAAAASGAGGGFCRDRTATGGSIFDADDVHIDRNTYQVIGQCVYILSEAEARSANAAATSNNNPSRTDMQYQLQQPPLSAPVITNNPPPLTGNGRVATTPANMNSSSHASSGRTPVTAAVNSRASVPTLLSRDDSNRASAQRRSSVIVHHHAVQPAAAMRKTSAGNYSAASGDSNPDNVKINSPYYYSSASNNSQPRPSTRPRPNHQQSLQTQNNNIRQQQSANTGFVTVADATRTGASEIYPASPSGIPVTAASPARPGEPQVMSTSDDVAIVFRKPSPSFVSSAQQQQPATTTGNSRNMRRHTSSSSSEHQHHHYQHRKRRVGPDSGGGGVVNVTVNDDDFDNAVIIGADDDEYDASTVRHGNMLHGKPPISPVPPQLPPKQRHHHSNVITRAASGGGGHTSVSDAFAATVNEIQTLHGLCGPGSSADAEMPSAFSHAEGDNIRRPRS